MHQTLIDYYKAIEASSVGMLEAARMADWDAMVRFEGTCAVLIAQLRARAASEPLDAASRVEKTRIMQRILGNDAQIRTLVEPWLAHCEAHFDRPRGYLH
jgi:flagellar protein FliT